MTINRIAGQLQVRLALSLIKRGYSNPIGKAKICVGLLSIVYMIPVWIIQAGMWYGIYCTAVELGLL